VIQANGTATPDEWMDDGVLLYTGEGQRGDMKFVGEEIGQFVTT
jgi:hypothetical protein